MKLGENKTVSEVRAFTAQDVKLNRIVYITDVDKEGEFVLDSTDTTSTDNLGTILVTNSGARYKRRYTGAVNVRWFNAKGDGTTNDTTAIQYCISNIDSVYIPKGTYKVDTLTLRSGVKLVGDGASTILKANSDFTKVINIYTAGSVTSNVTVSDLSIDGGGQTTDKYTGIKRAYGVYISNAQNITVERLYIYKCGVMNPSSVIDDVNFGGYGIFGESRNGEIRNIIVSGCTVTDIAGGGMQMGDGIMFNGFNDNTSIVPNHITIENCHVERVGRHCYSVGGEPPQSLAQNVYLTNLYGKDASLCGIDFEEGVQCTLDGFKFENCGNYTYYYNMATLIASVGPPVVYVYGPQYHLSSGIAIGNLCEGTTMKNGHIRNSNYGITFGGSSNILYENIRIEGSTQADMALRLARIGDNTVLRNIRCLTADKTVSFYSSTVNSNILIDSCYFANGANIAGLQGARFNNCSFANPLTLSGQYDTKNVIIQGCNFSGARGINFINTAYAEDITITNCNFIGNAEHGIYLTWNSVLRTKIINNEFRNITGTSAGAAITHANSDSQDAISLIVDNKFVNCKAGIFLNQGCKNNNISSNSFNQISGWCIDTGTLAAVNGLFNVRITGNHADNTCVNGLRILVGGFGALSYDYCIITDNSFNVSGTAYNVNSGNINGYFITERNVQFNQQGGADYTIGYYDPYRLVELNGSSAYTLNIPPESSVNFPIGTIINGVQLGTGQVTVVAGSGVTVLSRGGILKTNGQYSNFSLIKRASNTWYLYGDLERSAPQVQSAVSTATFTFNWSSNDIGVITAQSVALTVAEPTGTPSQGRPFILRVKDNGTARAITWNGIFRGVGVTLPTTTVANKTTYVSGYYNSTDTRVDIVGVLTES